MNLFYRLNNTSWYDCRITNVFKSILVFSLNVVSKNSSYTFLLRHEIPFRNTCREFLLF